MALSNNQIRQQIQKLLTQPGGYEPYISDSDIFPDYVIANEAGHLYKIPYTVQKGVVSIGEKKKVETRHVDIKEACSFTEAEFNTTDRVIKDVTLVEVGTSKNGKHYTAALLKRDGPTIYEGANAFCGHFPNVFDRTNPKNLMGTIKNVYFSEAKQALKGDFSYYPEFDDQIEKARIAHAEGDTNRFGMSIAGDGKGRYGRVGGKIVHIIEAFTKSINTSCDFVVGPSAGGRLFEAIHQEDPELLKLENLSLEELKAARPDLYEAIIKSAGDNTKPGEDVNAVAQRIYEALVKLDANQSAGAAAPTTITEAQVKEIATGVSGDSVKILEAKITLDRELRAANLPPDYEKRVREAFDGKIFEAETLEKEISFYKGEAAKISEARTASGDRISITAEPADKMQAAMDKLFGVAPADGMGDVKPFRGLREAYTVYTGDLDVVGHVKLSEAFTSASLPDALGNSMTKKLMQDYRAAGNKWRSIASVGSASDFKTQERIQVGYFGDIPEVDPETADYAEIAPYSDDKATGALEQRGSIVTVTRKHIINDDLNTVAKIVGRIGRAAARTLDKFVFDSIKNNETFTMDNTAFFHADHGNLGSTALSGTALTATRQLMRLYTEPGSGERLGWDLIAGDLVLVVPIQLEATAIAINQHAPTEASPNPWYHYFGANNERILTVPWLTDATDWYLATTAEVCDWLEILFLNGKEEPEMFLADNPVVGDMFIADKMKWKVRLEFGKILKDFRGCYKHVVGG
jgi:hypothetical protein